jgi:hypothetical protein
MMRRMQPKRRFRVAGAMVWSRLLRVCDRVWRVRSAMRAAAERKAAARDVAQKQMLMQQLASTLHASRERSRLRK